MIPIKDGYVGKARIQLAMSFNECVAMALKAIRLSKGFKQNVIVLTLQSSTSQASKMEKGESTISVEQLCLLCNLYDVTATDVFELAHNIFDISNKGIHYNVRN